MQKALVSPSTADFPFLDHTVVITGNRYKVSFYVDLQNVFGAIIRNNWVVIMIFNEGEWSLEQNWTLVILDIGDQRVYEDEANLLNVR
ncbi:MAG: hypothetical protein KAI16_00725 [Candidatus Pacebacteria bacterium]|nr:hypothetical protein [Candidatus Paceibacterota bacterium]